MNQVAELQQNEMTHLSSDDSSLIQVISRAASDPNTDVEKLERLMAMYERMEAKRAEGAFHTAMTRAQSRMGPIAADAENKQTHSKYASYAALNRKLRPIYTEEGFSLSFDTGEGAPADHIRMLCHVSHNAGFSRTYHADVPADGKGAKGGDVMTKTHAFGAGTTYGMRYLLKMIFNVAIGEDDIDGNKPPAETITEAQVSAILDLLNATGTPTGKLLNFVFPVNRPEGCTIEDIPAAMYKRCINKLQATMKQQGAAK